MRSAVDVIVRRLMPLIGAVTAGCAFAGEPAEIGEGAPDMARPGPVLVAELVNQTGRELVFSYAFEAADRSSTGSGEGLVPPCTTMVESWAEMTGAYSLMVDGEVLFEDRLAPGQGNGAYLFVSIEVGPNGETELLPPTQIAESPPLGSRPLVGCD